MPLTSCIFIPEGPRAAGTPVDPAAWGPTPQHRAQGNTRRPDATLSQGRDHDATPLRSPSITPLPLRGPISGAPSGPAASPAR
jgi:hypothetical protein